MPLEHNFRISLNPFQIVSNLTGRTYFRLTLEAVAMSTVPMGQ